jgi:hypothetical protein
MFLLAFTRFIRDSLVRFLQSLDGTMRMSSPEIEADASVQPEPVSQISSAALNSHPTPPSLVENDNQTRPRLSRSRSSSLSDLTPASSVVTSDEENIEHALNPVLSRIPGSFRIRELDLPPAAVYQPVRYKTIFRSLCTYHCFCYRFLMSIRNIYKAFRPLALTLLHQILLFRVHF